MINATVIFFVPCTVGIEPERERKCPGACINVHPSLDGRVDEDEVEGLQARTSVLFERARECDLFGAKCTVGTPNSYNWEVSCLENSRDEFVLLDAACTLHPPSRLLQGGGGRRMNIIHMNATRMWNEVSRAPTTYGAP
jgi:hypothetical protein